MSMTQLSSDNLFTACSTTSSKLHLCRAFATARFTTVWIIVITAVSRLYSVDRRVFPKSPFIIPLQEWEYSRAARRLYFSSGKMSGHGWINSSRHTVPRIPVYLQVHQNLSLPYKLETGTAAFCEATSKMHITRISNYGCRAQCEVHLSIAAKNTLRVIHRGTIFVSIMSSRIYNGNSPKGV